jgi:hypothetical protein
MSSRSKIKVATAVLLVVLSTGAASAATNRTPPPDSVLGRIQQIVKQIRRILLPLDEPTFPKP